MEVCVFTAFSQDYSKAKTLKDSILVKYNWEEFKNMSFQEKTDVIRELRGQEPRVWPEEKKHDLYGIRIVKNIPEDSVKNAIDSLVRYIDSKKSKYTIEVFPNSYADVMNEYFGGMYENLLDRSLRSENYKNFEYEHESAGQMGWITNFTKRSYFFNQEGEIKLIEIAVAYNINEGAKMKESEMKPLLYKKRNYYFNNDTLKYVYELSGRQRIDKYYHSITHMDLDSTEVDAYSNQLYFYKNNCFLNLRKDSKNKGALDNAKSPDEIKQILNSKQRLTFKNWKKELEKLQSFDTRIDRDTKQVIIARNYLLEYNEYQNNETDYLLSTINSKIKPYIIKANE
jgi:hypothetical protein